MTDAIELKPARRVTSNGGRDEAGRYSRWFAQFRSRVQPPYIMLVPPEPGHRRVVGGRLLIRRSREDTRP